MKLTEDDICITDDESFAQGNYYITISTDLDYETSKRKVENIKVQILQNQEKAEKWDKIIKNPDYIEQTENALKVLRRENTQLKEELKSAVTLLDNTSSAAGKLKSKLEKIKELVKELEYDYEEIAFTKFIFKLKELLEKK